MVVIFSPSLDFILCPFSFVFFSFFAFDYHVFLNLDAIVSRFEHGEGTRSLFQKAIFLILMRSLKMLMKGVKELTIMLISK